MKQPFRLLIDFSGAPQTGRDWGPMWNNVLWNKNIIHFQLFAEEVLKFKFNNTDLDNLRRGRLDNLSKPEQVAMTYSIKITCCPTSRLLDLIAIWCSNGDFSYRNTFFNYVGFFFVAA